VLVPLIVRETGLCVLLTQRSAHLTDHAGQISFPGGRQEPDDADAVAAALRETEEEIGLPRALVQVIGRLDTYVTGTGYSITPIVGLIRPPLSLRPDPFEVAEVFEVPLAFIADPANHQRHSREADGRTRSYYVIPYQQRFIWGATAGMLVNLARLLASDPA
jgi:8-oxo-dGTP pyrophosphatase MutT (NUDIX family)